MKTSKEASIRRCQPAQRAQRLAIPPDRIEEPAGFDRRADRAKVQLQKLLEAPLVVWVVVGWFGLGRLFGDENAKTRLSRCEHYCRSRHPNCAQDGREEEDKISKLAIQNDGNSLKAYGATEPSLDYLSLGRRRLQAHWTFLSAWALYRTRGGHDGSCQAPGFGLPARTALGRVASQWEARFLPCQPSALARLAMFMGAVQVAQLRGPQIAGASRRVGQVAGQLSWPPGRWAVGPAGNGAHLASQWEIRFLPCQPSALARLAMFDAGRLTLAEVEDRAAAGER